MIRPQGARLAGVQRSGIREIMDMARGRPEVLHLEVGEPDFPTPEHIADAAAEGARAGYTKYTSSRGLLTLRELIADKLERVNGVHVRPDSDIVVTAGAANALLVTLSSVVDVGGVVLVPDPGWPNYASMCRMLGLQVVRYPLPLAGGFQPDVEAIERLTRSRDVHAMIVNSPGNPTGSIIAPDRLEQIIDICRRAGTTLISDECYDEIILDDDRDALSPASLDADAQIVSVFSFSKTYAMTGWRIGYLAGPSESVDPIARVQETWLSCCSAPVQKAAEAALAGDQAAVSTMVDAYRKRKAVALMTAADLELRVHPPEGAFYLMVDLGEQRDGLAFARELLEVRHVAVAPGETFGEQTRGMVRVSLAAREEDIVTGLQRIRDHLEHG